MVTPEYGYSYADLIVKCGMVVVGCRHLIPWQVTYWKVGLSLKSARQGAGFRLLGLNPSVITWQLIFLSLCLSLHLQNRDNSVYLM